MSHKGLDRLVQVANADHQRMYEAAQGAGYVTAQTMEWTPVANMLWTPGATVTVAGYGEQGADTDGMAALVMNEKRLAELWPDTARSAPGDPAAKYRDLRDYDLPAVEALQRMAAKLDKMQLRAEQAERNLETAIRERDALRTELTQRMAMPARALKFSA